MHNVKKTVYLGLIAGSVIVISYGVLMFAKGYRFNTQTREVHAQGVLVANSYPNNSQLFINGKYADLTPHTIYLNPGTYTVRIEKEGYTPWEKTYTVERESVYRTDALLFLKNASLSPLTDRGLISPALSPDDTSVVYISNDTSLNTQILPNDEEKNGIFYATINSKTLSIFKNKKLLLPSSLFPPNIDITKTMFIYSPTGKNILTFLKNADNEIISVRMLSLTDPGSSLDVTYSYQTLLESWYEQNTELELKLVDSRPKAIRQLLSEKAKLIDISPDKKKILYIAKTTYTIPITIKPPLKGSSPIAEKRTIETGDLYVYNSKEDKNYLLAVLDSTTQKKMLNNLQQVENPGQITPEILIMSSKLFDQIFWYSDSEHVIIVHNDTIEALEYDGTNKIIIYSGPFEKELYTTTSDGKIVILTNFNPKRNELPDAYAVSIK
ncbi:MAG: PEGA domain-containing protein [Candidatus Roizmanbacteria bacterium]|nr:PEGA domain-containing protein [Candidatus Roizmanbacteria bacterium]